MPESQLIELTTSTLHGLETILSSPSPLSMTKDIIAPLISALFGAWAGAYIAFLLEKRRRNNEERNRLLGNLELILEDLKKAKRFQENNLIVLEKPAKNFPLALMPDTYFKMVDYVGLLELVDKNCVDHIRNISQYVFPGWTALVTETNDLKLLTDRAKEIIQNCDTVINSIQDQLEKIK